MARKTKAIGPVFPIPSTKKPEEKPIEEPQKTEEPQITVIEQQPEPITEQPTEKEKDHQQPEQVAPVVDGPEKEEPEVPVEATDRYSKYKKKPKYQTYVPHNVRIPKEMRRDLEKIAKKLGIPLGKNTGFFQEFTIDALQVAIDRAKKELGID